MLKLLFKYFLKALWIILLRLLWICDENTVGIMWIVSAEITVQIMWIIIAENIVAITVEITFYSKIM